ncbi:universal stress protein [Parathalassolituus penaei]|uniref:Universal stress protein n=1 Tax=Parathalassolituus penaei TaxID=2997323 RepID=A0A9X3EJS5_9GAMM|nr:universal stress protein [Parathalassolituus penaei]MCY0963868.1 universal stress protein [Parathalassolituus penaei]
MFYHVLIPVDLSHPEQLPKLIETARQLTNDSPHADFDFLYVDDSLIHKAGSPLLDEDFKNKRRRDEKDKLLALVRNYMPETLHYRHHVRFGTVHEKILEESKRGDSDVIVMMASKPGLGSYFVGSNAERVVRHAQCSVMVMREA